MTTISGERLKLSYKVKVYRNKTTGEFTSRDFILYNEDGVQIGRVNDLDSVTRVNKNGTTFHPYGNGRPADLEEQLIERCLPEALKGKLYSAVPIINNLEFPEQAIRNFDKN